MFLSSAGFLAKLIISKYLSKILSGILLKCQTFWIQMKDALSVLVFEKDHQQTTKLAANRQRSDLVSFGNPRPFPLIQRSRIKYAMEIICLDTRESTIF